MARLSGPLKSSVNAGQLSDSLAGRVNIKSYYSGARRMAGFEPIVQSGFSLLPGSRLIGLVDSAECRHAVLRVDTSLSYTLIVTPGVIAVWRNDGVRVAIIPLPTLADWRLPDLSFYGEANTVGIFHPGIWKGIRLRRNPANDTLWTVDDWPFTGIPDVDFGGAYPKTDDYWSIYLRWADTVTQFVVNVSVDGYTTNAARLVDIDGILISPDTAIDDDWHRLASAIRPMIRELPGLNNDVDIQFDAAQSALRMRVLNIVFSGSLAGSEYQVDGRVLNTAEASALAVHVEIGVTDGEPLISEARGGFADMALYQDRAIYSAPRGRKTALAMSRVGEYFDLEIRAQDDAAARLEALRTETAEEILHILDATYLLVFTENAEYFATNRTVKRNEPLNFVRASAIGSRRRCPPVMMEGRVYFVSRDGGQLYSTSYDAVSEAFAPEPVNDLNGDLVAGVTRMVMQRKTAGMNSARLWILRQDGRLLCGIANVAQDIPLAASEWIVAGGGTVSDISVDGQDQVWLTVKRGESVTLEMLQEASQNLLQCARSLLSDPNGRVGGLEALEGQTVWAVADNDVYGPLTVYLWGVPTDAPNKPATVGFWTPPVFESMPYVRVLPNDEVVRRPGKVGSVKLFVRNAASLAIGANGQTPKNVALNRIADNLDVTKKNFTGHVQVAGLKGVTMDPTLVITQVRPGMLNVRDYIPGVKL